MTQPTPAVTDATMQRLLGSARPGIAFLIRRGPAFDDPATVPHQWEHGRNMFALLQAGKLRQVTALPDGTDVLGLGLFALSDRAEAEAILRADPGVRSGRLTYQLVSDVTFRAGEVAF